MFSTENENELKREDTKNGIENPIINKKLADTPITAEREPTVPMDTA